MNDFTTTTDANLTTPPASEVAELYLVDLGLNWADLKGKSVLDLGAGLAEFARAALHRGVSVTSVEQRPELWQSAGEPPTDVPYVVADAAALPFDDNTFDLVISRAGPLGSEETQARFHQLMNEAIRVLKPGGELRFGPTPIAPSIVHADPKYTDQKLSDMPLDDRIVHLVDQTRQYLTQQYPGLRIGHIAQANREAPWNEYFIYQKALPAGRQA